MRSHRKQCPECGASMVKNGHDARGKQRWRCGSCGKTIAWNNDTTARLFTLFLDVILGKIPRRDLPGQGRTFRRHGQQFWQIWPVFFPDGQVHRVIHIDGIYLGKVAVVLIACTADHVVGWHVARSESTQAYMDLLAKIPPPDLVVCDGGTGFMKERKALWKDTKVQRCLFHVHCQIRRYTTTRSRTQAGRDLYRLSIRLLHVTTLTQRDAWLSAYQQWLTTYKYFLAEKTHNDYGKLVDKHERLVKARACLNTLLKNDHVFTFLDPGLYENGETIGSLPSTNNQIEGAVNSQLRALLFDHRGMNIDHQLRTIGWWCYLHTENPADPAEILRIMPTNTDITRAYQHASKLRLSNRDQQRWGTGIDWNDLHFSTPYRNDYEN